MMDRWNINIETKSDNEESLAIPAHKVLKVSALGRGECESVLMWSINELNQCNL